ncbi:MAG: D-glycero-beta-D-manno-heptose-7-phosphate kinase [Candidatus Omnitrophota bacterium]
MNYARLKQIITRFQKAKILVVGDLILDEYIWGEVERISPEAPVPVVWGKRRTFVPGGAANVAYNIRSLDARVCLAGVIGDDKNGSTFISEMKKREVPVRGIFREKGRHTTVKTRIIAGHQQVVRLDWEHTHPLAGALNKKLVGFIKKNIAGFDAVIVEDYGKGVINQELVGELIALAHKNNKIIAVDPKEEHFQFYRGVSAITPNRKELENAVKNLKISDTTNRFKFNAYRLFKDEDIDSAAAHILKYLGLDSVLVTLGEQGMRLFEKDGRITRIPTVAQEVFDVSGAGDTVVSCFSLALASGATKQEAARIANFAAGIVVGKIGTAVTSRKELSERMRQWM